ncbi:hypothetical protein TBLA_0C03250 [Henningerozyma blattae CBS 6284]|uniref:Mediator of RNA polymerase II transcription subunit 20 n=1 Tax=Henningerozyma blattae (strain ATCC 34711 / CBS 6284 / DSM 70876 / NBRC 10599 / NRRL Y-10934 / UCD 77-7) TaxID=1071380 RepID=I2H177_HENB6|nr:hypothetical protein TBLA_0C03250 [Tetrapisispora blattae CBS 6284]CCH60129.1 hypothetical protein TBLA_0C03250 [Tetrapisispora blattae CBS 6284]
MEHTAVIFIEKCTPNTLIEFKDIISHSIIKNLENWSLEFRTYRSIFKDKKNPNNNSLLYSINLTQFNKTILIKDGEIILNTVNFNDIPKELLFNGCNNGSSMSIDKLITNKLSNMWSNRQSIRGENGESFVCNNKLIVRIINLFSLTGFKGMLIEIENYDKKMETQEFNNHVDKICEFLNDIKVKDYKINKDRTDEDEFLCDLGQQYVSVLE